MFCRNCGKEILDDTKFCPSCGASQDDAVVKESAEGGRGLSTDLKRCFEYFSKIANVYNLHNIGSNLINNIVWCKKVKKSLIVGWVFFIFSIILGACTLGPILCMDYGLVLLPFLWEIILLDVILFIVCLVMIIKYSKHKSTLKFYKKKMPEWNSIINEHYMKFENCRVQLNYSDPVIIQELISYLDSMRADNLKEAINLYEDESHKKQMITEMKQMKEAAKQAASAATLTAINTFVK